MQAETAERGCTSSYNREAQEYLDLLFLLWLARPGLPGSRPFFSTVSVISADCVTNLAVGSHRIALNSGMGPRLVEVVLKQDHPFSA